MKWWRDLVDRWRRGPELRARQALVQELEVQLKEVVEENARAARAYVELLEQRRELLDFVTSGHVKARCRAPGCGDLSFGFALRRVEESGRLYLVAICEACGRRLERDAAAAKAAADGTSAGRVMVVESPG
jgi:hypothetical protein